MRISDWSSDVCSSDLRNAGHTDRGAVEEAGGELLIGIAAEAVDSDRIVDRQLGVVEGTDAMGIGIAPTLAQALERHVFDTHRLTHRHRIRPRADRKSVV